MNTKQWMNQLWTHTRRRTVSLLMLLMVFTGTGLTGCTQQQKGEVERAARMETDEEVATVDSPDVNATRRPTDSDNTVPAPRDARQMSTRQVASLESADLAAVTREDFIAEINRRIDIVGKEMSVMQDRSADISQLARKRWEKTMDELFTNRAELEKRLLELTQAEGDLWADFRPSVTAGWHQLDQVVQRANREFKLFTARN